MKKVIISKLVPFYCLVFLHASLACAGTFTFMGSTDKNPLAYASGEKMVFTVQLLEDGKPVAGKNLAWTRLGDDGKTNQDTAVSAADKPLTITTSLNQPGFVRIIVAASDESGKRLVNDGKPMPLFDGGAGVALDQIKAWPEPSDFDAFWAKQKAKLAAVPLRADLVPVAWDKPGVLLFDVKVDCAGKMPVSGYFCKPANAKPKSLPARVSFNGYGVTGASKPWDGATSLSLNINAHGFLNGQPAEYYQNLSQTTLKRYAFIDEENQNPETAYFNGMFLRVMRALEFIKAQPEWDGKTLIVSGGSQGGLQALAAAGRPVVPLREELDFVEAYLGIERSRLGHRLRVKVDVPEELEEIEIPPLSLQVLVENAIQHGVAPREDGGEIRVRARRSGYGENPGVVLSVDNPLAPASRPGTGNGLETLRGRLANPGDLTVSSSGGVFHAEFWWSAA